jgi:flagellar hook-associated protein 3 FlgL
MRVTFNGSFAGAVRDIQRAASHLAEQQQQVSSGKRIDRPSDDPSATAGAIGERAEMATLDRYRQAADTITSRLQAADTVLNDIVSQMTEAQAAALAGQGSAKTDAERETTAERLEAVSDALYTDFNTSFHGSYLFSGSSAKTAPYGREANGSVSAYRGNQSQVTLDVDRGVTVGVSFRATDILGTGPDDVFGTLKQLAQAVRAGDTDTVRALSPRLTAAFDNATRVQSQVGTSFNVVEGEQDRLTDMRRTSAARLSGYEDANMVTAISGMTQAETAYRAALGAIGSSGRSSLLDYLK